MNANFTFTAYIIYTLSKELWLLYLLNILWLFHFTLKQCCWITFYLWSNLAFCWDLLFLRLCWYNKDRISLSWLTFHCKVFLVIADFMGYLAASWGSSLVLAIYPCQFKFPSICCQRRRVGIPIGIELQYKVIKYLPKLHLFWFHPGEGQLSFSLVECWWYIFLLRVRLVLIWFSFLFSLSSLVWPDHVLNSFSYHCKASMSLPYFWHIVSE